MPLQILTGEMHSIYTKLEPAKKITVAAAAAKVKSPHSPRDAIIKSGRTELMQGQYIYEYFRSIITLCQNVTKEFTSVLMPAFHTWSKG